MSRQLMIQTKKLNAPPKTKTEPQARSPQHPMEEMQALYGNRAVNQLLASQPSLQAKPMFGGLSGELQNSPMQGKGGQTPTVLQAKLENGAAGDKYEQEADRDAAQELDRQKTPARALSTQEQLVQRQESKKEDIQDLAENTVQNGQEERKRTNQTGLPDALKAGVENLSGYSLDDVRVHYNSPKPAQLQALAYTQGTEIHVAPGQEKHLPHEAWHVVQQMQGRVKPTLMEKGMAVNDDPVLESEADVIAAQRKDDNTCANGRAWSEELKNNSQPIEDQVKTARSQPIQLMWGNQPERADLTHQPRNSYEVNREMCIDVMDELGLMVSNANTVPIARGLGNAWLEGRVIIRDFPHAGGSDSRLHITVIVIKGINQGTYHVPVVFERAGQLVLDDPTGEGITK